MNYRAKGLWLGFVVIIQSFVMLAEAGLQALRGKFGVHPVQPVQPVQPAHPVQPVEA